jgi:hypothetical protein
MGLAEIFDVLCAELVYIRDSIKEFAEQNNYSHPVWCFSKNLDTIMRRTLLRCIIKYTSYANAQDNMDFACNFKSQEDLESFIKDIDLIDQKTVKIFYLQEIFLNDLHSALKAHKDSQKAEDFLRDKFKKFDKTANNLDFATLPSLASLRARWTKGEVDTLYYFQCIYYVYNKLIYCQLLRIPAFSDKEVEESFAKIVCNPELSRCLGAFTGEDPSRLISRWQLVPSSSSLSFSLRNLNEDQIEECRSFFADLVYNTKQSKKSGSAKTFLLKAPGCSAELIDELGIKLLERFNVYKAILSFVSVDDTGAEKPSFIKRCKQKISSVASGLSSKASSILGSVKKVKIFGGNKQNTNNGSLESNAKNVEAKISKEKLPKNLADLTSSPKSKLNPLYASPVSGSMKFAAGVGDTESIDDLDGIDCFEMGCTSDDEPDYPKYEAAENGLQPNTKDPSGEIALNGISAASKDGGNKSSSRGGGNTNTEFNSAECVDEQRLGVQKNIVASQHLTAHVLAPKRSSNKGVWGFIQFLMFCLIGITLCPVLVIYLVIEYFAKSTSGSKQGVASGIPHNLGSNKENHTDREIKQTVAEPSIATESVQMYNRGHA